MPIYGKTPANAGVFGISLPCHDGSPRTATSRTLQRQPQSHSRKPAPWTGREAGDARPLVWDLAMKHDM